MVLLRHTKEPEPVVARIAACSSLPGAAAPRPLALLILVLTAWPLCSQDWPQFRGPNGSGIGGAKGLPVEFGASKNLQWKTAVPFGRSSPVVSAGKIFLTASEPGKLLTLAYDQATGRELWRRELAPARRQEVYKANDPASATPAADARSVYAFFPEFGIVSYGHDGKERWRHPLGPFDSFYGMSASPILAGDLLIQLCDHSAGSFMIAVDSKSGKQRWRTERKHVREGWSTPSVHKDQLITFGTQRIDSYYLATGEWKWGVPVVSNGSMGTPVFSGDQIFITAAGSDTPWMPSWAATAEKLDRDKDGRLSIAECKDEKEWFEHFGWVDSNHDGHLDSGEWDTARALGIGEYGAMSISLDGKPGWRMKRNIPYIPAPLLYEGLLYMVKTGGIITALNPATGAIVKQGRTDKALGEYYASPVAADGKLFLVNEEGKLSVVKAGEQWEVLSVNELGDETYATPAVSGNMLIVRTRGSLFTFAANASSGPR